MREVRDGAPNAVVGSRHRGGVRISQGGDFSDHILCEVHERTTGTLDDYGTRFIRRAEKAFRRSSSDRSFRVSNPEPRRLMKFALSIVWREVHGGEHDSVEVRLGAYEGRVCEAVFKNGDLNWPMLVSRTRFTLESDSPIPLTVSPYRVRMASQRAWTFTLAGYSFFMFPGASPPKILTDHLRADMADPTTIVIQHSQNLMQVGSLQEILKNMLA